MFTDFLYLLRAYGLPVGLVECQGSADLDIAHEARKHTGGFLRGLPGAAFRSNPLIWNLATAKNVFMNE